MDADRALRLLKDRLLELQDLESIHGSAFDQWKAKTLADVTNLFPEGDYAELLRRIWAARHVSGQFGARPEVLQQDFENQRDDSVGLLEGAMHEITEFWEPDVGPHAVGVNKDARLSRRVFVVHGHDNEMRSEIVRFLEQLDLIPVVLSEEPNQGRTIIEKFEQEANVGYAIVLYSPDDGCADSNLMRPRQNVVLEQGYFIGTLGRSRVTTLVRHRDSLELPSDVLGVVYVSFDQEGAWKLKLARELLTAEFDIDLNRLI